MKAMIVSTAITNISTRWFLRRMLIIENAKLLICGADVIKADDK